MLRMFSRVEVAVREERLDRPQLADRAVGHELVDARPQRVEAVHERLHQHDARSPAALDHPGGFGGVERQRLLAEYVLAGLRGAAGPRRVQVVGQRDVHRLDVGIGEQVVVRTVVARDPQFPGRRRGAVGVARGDRDDLAPLRLRIAGITLCTAIAAQPSTPKRSGSLMATFSGSTATFSQRPPVGRPITNDVANGADERETQVPVAIDRSRSSRSRATRGRGSGPPACRTGRGA